MPRAAGCKCHTICFQIGSANTDVKETASKAVGDGWSNRNREISRSEENVGSLCSLTDSFSYKDIMGEWWAVAFEYRLINRGIAGAMNHFARYIMFTHVRVNCATTSPRSAIPLGQFSNRQKANQYSQHMMTTIIDGSRCWMDNTLKWAWT